MSRLRNKEAIAQWLDDVNVKNYTINEDLTVDVKGSVDLSNRNLTSLPIQFGRVDGDFEMQNNQLITLNGAPSSIGGFCNFSHNFLNNLKGGPDSVGHDYDCSNNALQSLEGAPSQPLGNFFCEKNMLKSLEGITKDIQGNLYCNENPIQTYNVDFKVNGMVSFTASDDMSNLRLDANNDAAMRFNDFEFYMTRLNMARKFADKEINAPKLGG